MPRTYRKSVLVCGGGGGHGRGGVGVCVSVYLCVCVEGLKYYNSYKVYL